MNTDKNKNTTFHAQPAVSRSVTLSATWKARFYFSSSHLWAAKHFAQLAAELENLHKTSQCNDIQHRVYVTNAVLSSVAFLEAAINELCKDVVDEHESYISSVDEEARVRISVMWDLTEVNNKSGSILSKYQRILTYCKKNKMNENEQPYKDASLAIKLRNELMHYKPESYSGYQIEFQNVNEQHSLTSKLRDKFSENPLMLGSGNPYFPDKCLGSPCANWAVQSVRNLADEFFLRLNVIPHYQRSNL